MSSESENTVQFADAVRVSPSGASGLIFSHLLCSSLVETFALYSRRFHFVYPSLAIPWVLCQFHLGVTVADFSSPATTSETRSKAVEQGLEYIRIQSTFSARHINGKFAFQRLGSMKFTFVFYGLLDTFCPPYRLYLAYAKAQALTAQ